MPSILPTHFPSSPNPHPSHPHPISVPLPSHSPSASSSLFFRPHPIPLLSPTHSPSVPSPLSVRPQPTLPSPLLLELVHLLPCLLIQPTCSLVSPSTRQLARYSPNLFICYPVSSRIQLVNSSPHQLVNLPVTPRTCSPVTMSINTPNLLSCPLVNSSTCKLFLSSYFFVGTCLKHCNANSSLFVTHFYRQNVTINNTSHSLVT